MEIDGIEIGPGANLEGKDLANQDLRGSDLTGANLKGANLTDANLTDANLTDTNLDGAFLTKAKLRGAVVERQLRAFRFDKQISMDPQYNSMNFTCPTAPTLRKLILLEHGSRVSLTA